MLKQQHIQMLKQQLSERKKQLLLDTSSTKELINELLNEEANDELDYAEISSDTYNINTLRNKQIEELNEINIALKKIENKTYGICEMCDEEIGVKRLRVKPHARFCMDCRPVYEKSLLNK